MERLTTPTKYTIIKIRKDYQENGRKERNL